MKKLVFSAVLGAFGAAAFLHPPSAWANGPIPVVDESSSICNSLSLVAAGYSDYNNIQISMLQLSYDASRGEAVSAIQSAALSYCPEYSSYAPKK